MQYFKKVVAVRHLFNAFLYEKIYILKSSKRRQISQEIIRELCVPRCFKFQN